MKQDLKKKPKKAMKDNKPDHEILKVKQEFLKAMRLHNKIGKMELKEKEKRSQRHAQAKNPHQ